MFPGNRSVQNEYEAATGPALTQTPTLIIHDTDATPDPDPNPDPTPDPEPNPDPDPDPDPKPELEQDPPERRLEQQFKVAASIPRPCMLPPHIPA